MPSLYSVNNGFLVTSTNTVLSFKVFMRNTSILFGPIKSSPAIK